MLFSEWKDFNPVPMLNLLKANSRSSGESIYMEGRRSKLTAPCPALTLTLSPCAV
jgi:hypothetical protein